MSDGRVTILLERVPPSLNTWLSRHWRVRDRQKRELEDEIGWALTAWQLPRGLERVEARVTFRFPDRRRRDVGNYQATLEKCLGDTLVSGAWLADDTHRQFGVVEAKVAEDTGSAQTTISLDYVLARSPA